MMAISTRDSLRFDTHQPSCLPVMATLRMGLEEPQASRTGCLKGAEGIRPVRPDLWTEVMNYGDALGADLKANCLRLLDEVAQQQRRPITSALTHSDDSTSQSWRSG
jgi:hypothetical protein